MNKKYYRKLSKLLIVKLASYVRRLRNPQKYKSIDFFCDYLGRDIIRLNEQGYANKDIIITQVCTWDSKADYHSTYFPKKCACLISNKSDGIEAVRKGAVILITKDEIPNCPCLITDNPLFIYAKWCRYYRDLQTKVSVIAVSGSIGKTTIKNMIGLVSKQKYVTSYSKVNWNTRMSVGFAVQHIPNNAEKLIQEIHEGNPDETQYISEMLRPDIFVVTPIDKSHIARFGKMEKIEEEILSISKHMSEEGVVIVNVDDFNRYDLLNDRRVVTISTQNRNVDFFADQIKMEPDGLSFSVTIRQNSLTYHVKLKNLFAPHNALCALYAFAAGYVIGVEPLEIIKGLTEFETVGFRQNVIKTHDGIMVYADCYNAVGRSMKSAINTANQMSVRGKLIAVLGDIEEVGDESRSMHREVIDCVNNSNFEALITIGEKMKEATLGFERRDSLAIINCDTIEEIVNILKTVIESGDLVLFKSSHVYHLEKCIKALWPHEYREIKQSVKKEDEKWTMKNMFY